MSRVNGMTLVRETPNILQKLRVSSLAEEQETGKIVTQSVAYGAKLVVCESDVWVGPAHPYTSVRWQSQWEIDFPLFCIL